MAVKTVDKEEEEATIPYDWTKVDLVYPYRGYLAGPFSEHPAILYKWCAEHLAEKTYAMEAHDHGDNNTWPEVEASMRWRFKTKSDARLFESVWCRKQSQEH